MVISGVDSNKNVHPILTDRDGRVYVIPTAFGLSMLKFYSPPVGFVVMNYAETKTLGSVTIPNITGHTIKYGYCEVIFGTMVNLSASDSQLNGHQYIQIDNSEAGGWTNAIFLKDESFFIEGGRVETARGMHGAIDVTSKMNFNDTIAFRWLNSQFTEINLVCKEVQSVVVLIVE